MTEPFVEDGFYLTLVKYTVEEDDLPTSADFGPYDSSSAATVIALASAASYPDLIVMWTTSEWRGRRCVARQHVVNPAHPKAEFVQAIVQEIDRRAIINHKLRVADRDLDL